MKSISIKTGSQFDMINITAQIQNLVYESGIADGIVHIFVPHTTAGITINENADPDVNTDLLYLLDDIVPWNDPHYKHFEGNTAAHLKASMMGSSVQVIVEKNRLQLGRWQGIYFCEFDGPRNREIWLKILHISNKFCDISFLLKLQQKL